MAARLRPDYEVGYCKPPAAHKFKKGQSGNPKGKRKLSKGNGNHKSIAGHIQDLMEESVAVNQNGIPLMMPIAKAIAIKLTQQMLAGDMRVAKMVMPLIEKDRQLTAVRADSFDLEGLSKDPHAAARAYRRMITGK